MKSDIREISRILGCDPVGSAEPRQIEFLLTDSRSLADYGKSLFFAIKTPSADGARFVRPLYDLGVRAFVVREIPDNMSGVADAAFFVVPDPVGALGKIASRRPDFAGTLLAITGSRGKTSLKEWIFQLMEPLEDIVRSPRSFNSKIGVPLSMWLIQPATDLAIIEAGVSRAGEMQPLADIIRPDVVIITNIGDDHDEGFPSRPVKAREKTLLAAATSVNTVIYSRDSPLVAEAVESMCSGKRLLGWSFSDPSAPLYIRVDNNGESGSRFTYLWRSPDGDVSGCFDAPVVSEADRQNVAAALAFMLWRGVPASVIAYRFPTLCPIGTRINVSEGVNGCSVIYDSYTSDFSSLSPALDFMRRRVMPGMEKVVVLSDLRHEAAADGDVYAAISSLVGDYGIERFVGVGPAISAHSSLFPEGSRFFSSTSEFLDKLSPSDFSDSVILLKGAPEFEFGRIQEMLEARTHETVLEVNLDSIVKNFNYFRSHVPASTGMIAMVKASGYGAGSYEIAKTLQSAGAAYLAVAVLDEGIDLRSQGITMPIMVMNPKVVNYKAMFANRLEPEIYSMEMLHDVIREARKNGVMEYPVHIKLDTGMHRMGFIEEELPALMDTLLSQQNVVARSVFSHLATADCPDMDDYTLLQLKRFRRCSDYMQQRSRRPILRHVLNSAGILRFPEHHYDMVRLGIGLYGVNTLPPEMEKPLETVSSLRTVVIAVREYEAGETIGYGRRGVLTRPSRIATIPIGYADGMNRHFGRGAISVRINGCDAPTIGNICMDACMVDVTDIPCRVGDAVEIFGPHASVQRLADVLDTIPYEVLTSVSPRVKRVYYRE